MDEQRVPPGTKSWQYIFRGAGYFTMLFLIKSLTTPRLVSSVTEEIPRQIFYGFALLGIILIYNSLVHTFTLYDTHAFMLFQKRRVKKIHIGEELAAIFKAKEFWLETIPVICLSVVFSLLGGFFEVVYTVFSVETAPEWAVKILPLVLLPILLFTVSLLCRYEIHRYWFEIIEKGEEKRVESRVKFSLKLLLVLLMYPLLFPYAPSIVFIVLTFFGIVGTLISVLSVLGLIAAVAVSVLCIIGILRWKNSRKRKKFIHSVKQIANQNGSYLEIYDKEQRTVRGYDFMLISGGVNYQIKIIECLSRNTPLYFTSSQDAYFLYRIGTKSHHTSMEKHFNYSFVGEGQKLIVLIGFPKRLFASEFGATRKLFPGDKIWNYIIYNISSFLGSQDRECLYRSNEDNR